MPEKQISALDIIKNKMRELDEEDSYGIVVLNNGVNIPLNKNFLKLKEELQAFADAVNSDDELFKQIRETGLFFIEVDDLLINPFGVYALIQSDKPVRKRQLPFF